MPVLYLLGVVALLSSITPIMKSVFLHSRVNAFDVSCGRVSIGFLFLAMVTACLDWRGLRDLDVRDGLHLGAVGIFGVSSYAIAAWGLMHTSVTHYALIYSFLPTFTTLFGYAIGNGHKNLLTWCGIVLSWIGCTMAVSDGTGPKF